jgi:membrane-associated phospholipid phosphatase
MKRIAGREVPFASTKDGGEWRPFPSFPEFNTNKTRYDAFPSGHIATMMATVVVLGDNYPEKRWIYPVGYGIIGLVSLSMLNNGVHWASDYPLGLAIGYVFGKVTVRMNRIIRQTERKK